MPESKLFVGQKWKLILQTEIDLNEASGLFIKYKSPAGVVDEVTATVVDMPDGAMFYDFGSEINAVGVWKFWAYATFDSSGDSFIPGEVVELNFNEQG